MNNTLFLSFFFKPIPVDCVLVFDICVLALLAVLIFAIVVDN